jgi:hypothetical protein
MLTLTSQLGNSVSEWSTTAERAPLVRAESGHDERVAITGELAVDHL